MKLQEIMVTDVIQALPEESIGGAAKRMRQKAVGCLVVSVDGTIKGIITDRDLLACVEQGHDPYRCQIAAHMSHPVRVLRPEEEDATAVDVMRRRRIKRLPVARSGKLLGIVSMSDLAAVAEADVERIWPSWVFIKGLVRTQASQGRRVKLTSQGQGEAPMKTVV